MPMTPERKPESEASLLERTQEQLPEALRARYRALQGKRAAETLTAAEHGELLHLLNQVEAWNVRRLQAVADLAKLRGVPFPELVKQLGLYADRSD